jgi:ryanodine receptor 2
MSDYIPSPIDTSDIKLPDSLVELTEKIAENVHEIWAQGRIDDGWTYGTERDDDKKTTPCLVAYSDLSESEKQYDRNTALETLKLIIKLGYKVEKDD